VTISEPVSDSHWKWFQANGVPEIVGSLEDLEESQSPYSETPRSL
jgi:hypothetical protein